MNTKDIQNTLEQYIRQHFGVGDQDEFFSATLNLWEEGYIDSTGIVELIAFIEEQFSLTLPDEVIFEPEFGTIAGMAERIEALLAV
jgi:acyl carrier protein